MRKRSKYRPRAIVRDPLGYVLMGIRPVKDSTDLFFSLEIKLHDALSALEKGQATPDHLRYLVEAGNVSEAFARQGLGADWGQEIGAAQGALKTVIERERWVCRSDELACIRILVEVHDAQLSSATILQLESAMDLVLAEVKAKRAMRVAPYVTDKFICQT